MIIKFTRISKGQDGSALYGSMINFTIYPIRRPFMNYLFRGSDGSFRYIKPKNRKMKVVWEE